MEEGGGRGGRGRKELAGSRGEAGGKDVRDWQQESTQDVERGRERGIRRDGWADISRERRNIINNLSDQLDR